jgi:hypothetical protein
MNLQAIPKFFSGNHLQKITYPEISRISLSKFDRNKFTSSNSYNSVHQVFGTFSIIVGMLYSQDMLIKLRFGELLKQRGITPNRLWQSGHGLSRNTVYGLANPSSDRVRIDLDVLAQAMNAVFLETGQSVSLDDIFEVIEEPVPPDPEEVWLNSSASDLKAMLEDVERNEKPKDVAKWANAFAQAAQ